jgi:hypothetical protein
MVGMRIPSAYVLLALAACSPGDTPVDEASSSTSTTTSEGGSSSSGGPDAPTSTTSTTTLEPTGPTTGETGDTLTGLTLSSGGPDACLGLQCGALLTCCAAGEACVGEACVPACASGVYCGDGLGTCCGDGELCVDEACAAAGAACESSADCGEGEYCEPVLQQCAPLQEPLVCQAGADVGLVLEWSHTADQVIAMPVVVDLSGDMVPEVVVNTMRASGEAIDYPVGELICLDGQTGAELWRIPHDPANMLFGAHGRATVGAGDLSGDGLPDIVYAGRQTDMIDRLSPIHAVDGDGALLWTARNPDDTPVLLRVENGAAALVNLDDDPMAEVAFGAAIFDHDGLLVWNQGGEGALVGSPHNKNAPDMILYSGGLPTFADLTGDGYPELVTGREAWSIAWTAGSPPTVELTVLWQNTDGWAGDGWPAVADLDQNGTPEVVLVAWPEIKILDGATGELWCGVDPTGVMCQADPALRTPPIDVPGGNLGGPATIADFDGDGRPEFGLTTGADYRVFDIHRAGELIVKPPNEPMPAPGHFFTRWARPVQDKSSASTGGAAFDFDADGDAEVFYQDECNLRVFDGGSGEILLELANSTATIHEYPVIADVDGDGESELLSVANHSDPNPNTLCQQKYPGWQTRQGVYAYRPAAAWTPTAAAWTMHGYHVTNVDADGNVPLSEQANWLVPGLNNFREATRGPTPVTGNAPDLGVTLAVDTSACPTTMTLRATVRNDGALGVAAGVTVALHLGTDASGPLLQSVPTSEPLVPGATTEVVFEVLAPPQAINYFVLVDADEAVDECREQNNGALAFGAAC